MRKSSLAVSVLLIIVLMNSLFLIAFTSPPRCEYCQSQSAAQSTTIVTTFSVGMKENNTIQPLYEPHSVPVWTYFEGTYSESPGNPYLWCMWFHVSCATRATWFSGCENYYTPYWEYKLWYMNWDTGQWEEVYSGWGESPNDWHLDWWWPFNARTSYSSDKFIDGLQAGTYRMEIILSGMYGGYWECYAVPHSDYFYVTL